jgi:hypothetical protein
MTIKYRLGLLHLMVRASRAHPHNVNLEMVGSLSKILFLRERCKSLLRNTPDYHVENAREQN